MSSYSNQYNDCIKEEEGKTAEEVLVANVGKIDPKRHLVRSSVPQIQFTSKKIVIAPVSTQENSVEELMSYNILQLLGSMLATVVF
jgi:26S proteasome regulatory subunit N11